MRGLFGDDAGGVGFPHLRRSQHPDDAIRGASEDGHRLVIDGDDPCVLGHHDGHREQQDRIGVADGQERVGRDHFVAVAVSEIGADVFEPVDSLLVRRGGEVVE